MPNKHTSVKALSKQARGGTGTTYSPLYQQIKSLLLQRLDQGEWRPGEAIPSEHELAARFQVSQGTVRKAIDEMAADNHLVRQIGRAPSTDRQQLYHVVR